MAYDNENKAVGARLGENNDRLTLSHNFSVRLPNMTVTEVTHHEIAKLNNMPYLDIQSQQLLVKILELPGVERLRFDGNNLIVVKMGPSAWEVLEPLIAGIYTEVYGRVRYVPQTRSGLPRQITLEVKNALDAIFEEID